MNFLINQTDKSANKALKLTANPLRPRLAVVGSLALTLKKRKEIRRGDKELMF
ncbi:hypothetical protein JCM12298_27010 [Desulfothermus naphthae]